MKLRIQCLIGAFAGATLAYQAGADDLANPTVDRSDFSQSPRNHGPTNRLNGAAKASDVLGMTVNNYKNEKLGKVEDLAMDMESGRIVLVILSTGGFAGIGDTHTAVPPGALHHDTEKQVLHLNVDLEKLKAAPKFESSNWDEHTDSKHVTASYTLYGEGMEQRSRELFSNSPGSHPGQIQRASKVLGTPVKNAEDQKLGKVENLILDLGSGRIVAVIVSSGGFLGIGDELSAIPPHAFRFATDRVTLQLNATRETLIAGPHFKADQWPAFDQPTYAHGIYKAYNFEPYFATNQVTQVGNVDGKDRHLTPLDQGNDTSDVNITRRIRRGILENKGMSVNAQNVKIITAEGQVTLRGPVNTAEEKRLIGDIAIDIALVDNVDNQLEVK